MSTSVEVEALFGSVSRGDADSLSDRDIIIIDSNLNNLKLRQQELEAEGASVASYTWKRLSSLCEKGALFVQHLKLESETVHDKDGRFRKLLEDFVPKDSYKDELIDNARLAAITSFYPDSDIGALWAADVLFVSLRNYGVLKLAESQQYIFSYDAILSALCEKGQISPAQKTALQKLRLMKSNYRKGSALSGSKDILNDIVGFLPEDGFSNCCNATSSSKILDSIKPLEANQSIYARLRNIEKAYVALTSLEPSLMFDQEFLQIKRWIENPRTYAFLAAKNEKKLLRNIINAHSELIKHLEQNHPSILNLHYNNPIFLPHVL